MPRSIAEQPELTIYKTIIDFNRISHVCLLNHRILRQ